VSETPSPGGVGGGGNGRADKKRGAQKLGETRGQGGTLPIIRDYEIKVKKLVLKFG